MPIGIGLNSAASERRDASAPAWLDEPCGFHPGAVRVAAATSILATLLLLAQLVS